jgi:ankyrin repeat domain-containing protein 50
MRDNLSLALDVLQLRDHKTTQDELAEMKSLVEQMRATQVSSAIQDWFKAPDALINHNVASEKRHSGTGTWFVKGPVFHNWINQANSFLWLNGFAGCGKSVLCSTAIQHAFRQRRRDANIGIAFFYLTFNDESKRDQSAMLRALLWQLAGQHSDGPSRLQRLHDSYRTEPPPAAVLREQLRECIQRFHQVYILVDALDESPRGSPRDKVLDTITTMRDWSMPGLHLLVASRDELDIRESLNTTSNQEVTLKNDEIDRDINNFIAEKLSTDPKLRNRWRPHRDRIQHALAERARGV